MVLLCLFLCAILSYFLGSCNFSIIMVRLLKGKDIRDYGSHNAGLTNTLRCFGKGCALCTLIGDLGKGIVAVFLSRFLCLWLHAGLDLPMAADTMQDVRYIGYIAGIFAILGHVFPLYYHFKGGKGVLVGVSVFLGIDWRQFLCLLAVFVVVLALTKYVSLGSMIAAGFCPVLTFLFQLPQRDILPWWYIFLNTALSACMGLWIIFMHRSNIQRLRSGVENRFSFHTKSE